MKKSIISNLSNLSILRNTFNWEVIILDLIHMAKKILRIHSQYSWFKRVFVHDKKAIFLHEEKQLNQRFNQYYKFLKALRCYDIITVKEAHKSSMDIKEQQLEEKKELLKNIWPEKFKKI